MGFQCLDICDNADVKRHEHFDIPRSMSRDVSALDALATAAVLGETGEASPSTATTKHPRHRSGCSCIVCIQPPSGKGPKHKPTCTCNVCMTVRRRFKTLMMRRKKRQSEQEEERDQKKNTWTKEEGEIAVASKCSMQLDTSENEGWPTCTPELSSRKIVIGRDEVNDNLISNKEDMKGQIDLNCDPDREDDTVAGSNSSHVSMVTLLPVASLPLDAYLKPHGLTSLVGDPQTNSSVSVLPRTGVDCEIDESHFPSVQEDATEDAYLPVDQMATDVT